MHIVGSFTSGYFPFYDDEYGRVHYDDDDDNHALLDIRGFALDVLLRLTSSTTMGLGVCEPPSWLTLARVSRV